MTDASGARRWPLPALRRPVPTAVVFLLRGRDPGYEASLARFLASYRRHPAGCGHDLVLLCKGFDDTAAQAAAEAACDGIASRRLTVPDDGFDLGAYRAAARLLPHDRVCFLNSHTEILSDEWLLKLALNLERGGIGFVGGTGSLERLRASRRFPPFPNVHLRSNGFLIDRRLFLRAAGEAPIRDKLDAFLLESGPDSLTRRVLAEGQGVLIVGADGRGYPPRMWARTRTFRLGEQDNLLFGDNQTRKVLADPWRARAYVAGTSWGRYLAGLPPADLGLPRKATAGRR